MKTVFSYVKPYKWPIAIALFLMLIELSVELIQPLIIAKIIDDGIMKGDVSVIWTWGGVMMLMAIIAFLSGATNSFFASHASQSFGFDVRTALFKQVQQFTVATFTKFPTAGLITRLTSDVTMVQNVLFMSLRIMLRAPLLVIGSVIMAFIVNAYLAIFLVIGAPFLIFFLYFMVKKGVSYFALVQVRLDRVNRVLQENLQAVRLVKAYLRGQFESSRFEKVSNLLKMDTVKALRVMEIILPLLLLVMNISLLAVLWFGASEIKTNNAQIGELVAIVNYALRMTGAFSMFSFIIMAIARAKASAERMEEVLLVNKGLERDEETGKMLGAAEGEISFHNVTFSYPNSPEPVLKNISFDVKSGEKLAIMGATGTGKSTLLQLIPRFFEASAGSVKVDGKDVRKWSLDQLRQAIGLVPQQSLLFTGSIYQNLAWGKIEASTEELQHAAKQAQIHTSIEQFAKGYDTRVGQKGVNLSGGQKQRLSIARALVRKPEILLLDDSTSALDVKTEAALWEALDKEEATMLVVTQKIRTAKGADRVLLLDNGEIAAYGSHEELLQTSDLYRQIAESQQEQEVSAHETDSI
ncbi:ABC transporter ATP-binding protein [Paenisporosarcina sp. OV554]|uniref:ABC transporter ATP-binding protein n=1 Tax=Paenisporosarcina sp. OV554 TaxID=2135694 RepID=UPI000D354631|nr:ABC transporter ATP-binding protein [Paenisporosarcina sp. OV554]PUB16826.1 ATP-binding cassette subfamily B protein [Paenisporosarcina sp. OV554]